ncbi:MAG: HAD-IA family hydrolase [Desulfobacteraceae bacterium]|nr:HAD-IA family hydrolase [Desulfobacteraceae bacterium]MBC2757636.1 HAD-IA family hydrolase [Desulfobacteraceae bacterium]MBC2763881.1 HAD-IA family hydrolase [ANME-2 cluster archaeon]
MQDSGNKIKVLTFDCDGVMFDTEKANKAYYNHLLNYFGRPSITPDQFVYVQMHTVDESIAHLFPDRQSFEAAQSLRKQTGYDPYLKYMEIEPDLISLLEKYTGRLNIAVATNRTDTMNKVLAVHDIEKYFDLVVTALDVPRPKPHPDPLLRVLEYFHVAPDEMLYVGDSELDDLAAKAAGVPLVAYDNVSLAGDYHITSLKELEKIITI